MASANLNLIRSIHAAWERGDFSSTEELHPEIEFVIADGPSPLTWTGLSGRAEGARDFLSAWEVSASRPRSTVSSTASACSCSPRASGASGGRREMAAGSRSRSGQLGTSEFAAADCAQPR
jgi:ketosteroid isomerase-like protein